MRFVSIGKPHVHHEAISVVGAFDPSRARLWFQSHRDKSHLPKLSRGCKKFKRVLRLSDPRRRRYRKTSGPPCARAALRPSKPHRCISTYCAIFAGFTRISALSLTPSLRPRPNYLPIGALRAKRWRSQEIKEKPLTYACLLSTGLPKI